MGMHQSVHARALDHALARRILFVLAGWLVAVAANAQTPPLPSPDKAGFEHVVVVMMENRSFDHFLGWLPGANGQQTGLNYSDSSGTQHATHALAPDYQG